MLEDVGVAVVGTSVGRGVGVTDGAGVGAGTGCVEGVGVVGMRDIIHWMVELFPSRVLNVPPEPGSFPRAPFGIRFRTGHLANYSGRELLSAGAIPLGGRGNAVERPTKMHVNFVRLP